MDDVIPIPFDCEDNLCIYCRELNPVCCDSGYTEDEQGHVIHEEPKCTNCCIHKASRRYEEF